MENFYSRMRNFKLPKKDQINSVFSAFSKREQIIFIILFVILLGSTISILESINKSLMVKIPFRGGTISEGVIGIPRFINPVLANSPADLDLVSLIYSGLMRKNLDGTLIPDLAEKYVVSPDGLTYTFTLKDKIFFQNGEPITADDVIFTVNKARDTIIKSPRKVDWDGVTATKINNTTVAFTLKQPNLSFLENADIGIMPQSLWNNSPIELNDANINPVGSGPYMMKGVSKESSGVIDSYTLAPFKKFILGEPYIQTININFYSTEDDLVKALQDKEVDQISSISPLNADILKERNYKIETSVLPRVFGLFFNQNQNQLFTDKVVDSAINQTIDKDKIVREVLYGYGITINDPIPPSMIAYRNAPGTDAVSRDVVLQNVQNSLAQDGWSKGPDGFLQKTIKDKNKTKTVTTLQFSISTGNAPDLAKTADLIKADLTDIGMKVDVKTFDVGNLNQSVIRPRKYDALLFGEIINHESDLFAFWHSSQRKDPGLNVAMYTSAKVDKILQDAAVAVNEQDQINKYTQFEDEIKKDMPAVFLYSPDFIYVVSSDESRVSTDKITYPADRFSDVYLWYTETENVWKIFSK